MNFYVNAVNKIVCEERDQPTIWIVLCKSKSKTVAEFTLNSINSPIGVSTYKLQEELPPELRSCLPTAEQLEVELDVAMKNLSDESSE